MCMFTAAELKVSNTRIFATTKGGLATLVYAMNLGTPADAAMILPLPVEPEAGEAGLSFVNLEGYPDFFDDLIRGFPSQQVTMGFELESSRLKVHAVGAFEASFVPSLGDFGRLDPRFRLPGHVWQQLPRYADHGFAVFRLAPGAERDVHPMAFQFLTRFGDRIFFPTVHVHDGEVHERADFDHALYYQRLSGRPAFAFEETSSGAASAFVDVRRAAGLVDPERPVYRRVLRGSKPNRDVFIVESAERGGDLYEFV